jgi:hypothetical protein
MTGWIYIIGSYENLEMVKIGKTVNLLRRLSEIQTSSPFLMVLHASYPIDYVRLHRIEAGVHEKMNNHKVRGEWFNIHPREACKLVSDYIASQNKRSRKKVLNAA